MDRKLERPRLAMLPYLLASVPALVVGVLVMRAFDVPAFTWGQNLAAWVVGALLCLALRPKRISSGRPRWPDVVAVLTCAALAATLLLPGMDGVHRWVPVGPLRLHAGAILLPLLIVALDRLSQARGWWTSTLLALGVVLLLYLQPDAAQATAFSLAAVVVLLPGAGASPARLSGMLALPGLASLAWLRRDPLAPVAHVEEIVGLAARLGTGWAVAAGVSLLLLPLPFLLARRGAGRRTGVALGVYVAITVAAAFVGHFPVPVMGYGVSPIIGYLAGLGILLHTAPSAD